MAQNNMITIEVAYATPQQQHIIKLEVPPGTTIEEAIQFSSILSLFPEIDLHQQKVGVFSKQKALSDVVNAGDRIEIYRPLTIDPKEARRAREKMKAARKT